MTTQIEMEMLRAERDLARAQANLMEVKLKAVREALNLICSLKTTHGEGAGGALIAYVSRDEWHLARNRALEAMR